MRNITRTLTLLLLLLLSHSALIAQNWNEIFRQKKTQQQYHLKQIAGLQLYLELASKGYQAAAKGITTIRDIKNGDFLLHQNFFISLGSANPKFKALPQVSSLLEKLILLSKGIPKARSLLHKAEFTASEKQYLSGVYQKLSDDCAEILEQATALLSSGFNGSDAQRLTALNGLAEKASANLDFFKSFSTTQHQLSKERIHELQELKKSRALLNINP